MKIHELPDSAKAAGALLFYFVFNTSASKTGKSKETIHHHWKWHGNIGLEKTKKQIKNN